MGEFPEMTERCQACCLMKIPRRKLLEIITRYQMLNQNV